MKKLSIELQELPTVKIKRAVDLYMPLLVKYSTWCYTYFVTTLSRRSFYYENNRTTSLLPIYTRESIRQKGCWVNGED
eukprot:snap_masked-scaffold_10-processed-gene-12.48-mRNA-1 protein AED:1.00 eAED:1.00 QI:0/0/0/0/1/1/2/0/77